MRRRAIANYTEVYEIDESGDTTLYCWLLNQDSLVRQLACLLLNLQKKPPYPFRTIDGSEVDPLKEAEEKVTLTGVAPMPRGFVEHDGKVYFGHIREYREIEIKA